MNYFEKFDLKTTYNIDLDLLDKRYFEYQQELHPDKYVNKSEQEKIKALEDVIEVNKAYKVLKSDLHRAEYLMSLQGINVSSEEDIERNHEILAQAFEDRQKLEEAETNEELDAMLTEVTHLLAGYKTEFDKLYTKRDFKEAAKIAVEMRYKTKFLEEIQQKL